MRKILLTLALALGLNVSAQNIPTPNTNAPKLGIIGKNTKKTSLSDLTVAKSMGKKSSIHRSASATTRMETDSFGFLEGADGKTWYYTQHNQVNENYLCSASNVTIFDANNQKRGEFTIEFPDSSMVNAVEPYGMVTNKLFDLNASTYEVTIFIHEITPDYVGKQYTLVYNLNGNKVGEYPGDAMIVDASINDWTKYQRLITVNTNAENHLQTDITFYRPASWGETTAQVEHVISINSLLINYMDAPFLNFYNDNGKPYYVLCYYEKSFDIRDENGDMIIDPETYMPEFTPDNHFIVKTLDRNYNTVDSLFISTEAPEDVLVRMMGLGAFSNLDINRGVFTKDNTFNYIIMYEDCTAQLEATYSFGIYDHEGNLIDILAENIGDYWNELSDISGKEHQFIFLTATGEELFTVDVPSLNTEHLPQAIEDKAISTNFDRFTYPSDPKGYRYVMSIDEADMDEENNVIAMFAHLTSDFKLDHMVRFNLGPLAQTFSPLVNYQSLNPFLFNTDNQHEYIFFSKIRKNYEDTEGRNVLFIGNDSGEILRKFDPMEIEGAGDIWTASILNYGTNDVSLFVNYYNWDEDKNIIEFTTLPFASFEKGGSGTAGDPYLISSVGDMQQIYRDPSAYYRIANEFDGSAGTVSIEEFSGTLDGDNIVISNLNVTGNGYYGGLFGSADGATVKNLRLWNPTATITSGNEYFGLLTGYAIGSTFDNIVVEGMNIRSESGATPVGGLVGLAAGSTVVSDCYVKDSEIEARSNVGGLVGEMRTGSTVKASAITGSSVIGINDVGGLVGTVGNGCTVSDCYVEADVTGKSSVAAAIGHLGVNGSRGLGTRIIVANSTTHDNGTQHKGFANVAGYIDPEWVADDKPYTLNYCVAYDSKIAFPTQPEDLTTVHAIAGLTKLHMPKEKESDVMEELELWNNYVAFNELPTPVDPEYYYFGGGEKANKEEGKLVSSGDLIPQEFWTNLTYKFTTPGAFTSEPAWLFESGKLPWLPIMDEAVVPTFIPSIPAGVSETATPENTGIYNLNGQCLTAPVKGAINIVNGKKIIVK